MMPDCGAFKNSPGQKQRIDQLASDLQRQGFASTSHFLDSVSTSALTRECRDWQMRGSLHAAGVGHGHDAHRNAQIRGDQTAWFDAAAATPAQETYWQAMQALRRQLNRSLLLGLDEIDAHYAWYRPGMCYARHRDSFRDDDSRVLSSVFYLNDNWQNAYGGALRIHLNADAMCRNPYVDIYPQSGRLALFLSAPFEHEVLAATRDRLSIAGWFRQRAQPLSR